MRVIAGIVAALLLVIPLAGHADEALAKKHNCTACHQIDKKSVGPAYQEVAKKYKGQADAAAKLAAAVKKGSNGIWGPVPMPPNAAVPDDDVNKLVAWVLGQAK